MSLEIEVKAIRLLRETLAKMAADHSQTSPGNRSANYTFNREWISLDDILMRIQELTEQTTTAVQQLDFSDAVIEEDRSKKKSCICMCFSQIFSRRKNDHGMPQNGHGSKSSGLNGYRLSPDRGSAQHIAKLNTSTQVISHHTQYHQPKHRESIENLRNMADTFRQKANALYSILRDPSSVTFVELLKYFEQDRGVLVLDTSCEEGLVIVNICMKVEQLEQLRRDYQNGRLTQDIEKCIITDDVLQTVGAKGVKLRAAVNQDEFDLAEQELCWTAIMYT